MNRYWRDLCGAFVCASFALWQTNAIAGDKSKAEHAPATAEHASSKTVLPDADKIVLLIRTSLLTVNDAVQTGNFTVLRDKAAPSFRDGTTPRSLAKYFDSLTEKRIDLSAVSIIAPQLTDLPTIDKDGHLKLKGYFPGKPAGIGFNISYVVVAGNWRLSDVGIFLVSSQPAPAVAAQQQRPATASSDPDH